jgi:hypothetical protein
MKTQNTQTQIETVESVRSRQVIWVDWMQKATAGLSDDSLVEVTTQHTPFGDYCLGIKPVEKRPIAVGTCYTTADENGVAVIGAKVTWNDGESGEMTWPNTDAFSAFQGRYYNF